MLWVLSLPPLWINGHPVNGGTEITDAKYHALQFGGPILPYQKEELMSLGIRFYDYYPKYAFVVSGSRRALETALQMPYVVRIVPIRSEYKFSPYLKDKLLSGCYLREGNLYVARIVLFNPEDLPKVRDGLKRMGASVVGEDVFGKYVEVKAPYDLLRSVANLSEVQFVEFRHPITNWNNRKAITHQSGLWLDLQNSTNPNDTIVWKKGLHGEGQILGHNDDGLDKDHCFFSGTVGGQPKIVDLCDYNGGGCGAASLPAGTQCNSNPGTGCHGTHTAGTAVGYSSATTSASAEYKGLAYMSRIVSQTPLGGGSGGFGQVLQDAYNRGARVHTNSWGMICPNLFGGTRCAPSDYSTDARTIDNFVWTHPDMTVVFAAGNHGDDGCASGCYRTPSDPATAKDDITVGAMGRAIDAKMGWSAYGSFGSGRFGNDIMAIGDTTYSAWGGTTCSITTAWWWMGTSMATPATAGGALLIRQYYLEGWYGDGTRNSAPSHNPTAALVKASLLASAVPIAHDGDVSFGNESLASNNPVPNGNEGAGRFVLDNFMYFTPEDDWNTLSDSSDERKSRLWFVDNTTGLNTGDSVLYTVNVCNPNMVTRFVLAWSDYPASTNCATGGGCLVNDLDLTVYGPSGEVYIGNATTTGADNLTPNDNTIAHDNANTWEIVRVKGPTGDFTIKVKGANVPNGPQPFALVVSGGLGPCALGGDNDLGTSERRIYTLSITPVEGGIAFAVPEDERVEASVYTVSGRRILKQRLVGEGRILIPGSGVYMIVVRRNGHPYGTFKVVVR